MDLPKKLVFLVEQATSDANLQPSLPIYQKILEIIKQRVDMPKHTIAAISKRLIIKQKKVLFYCFDLLEFLSFRCEQSLYMQICTKEFLLKVSGLLLNQDISGDVHTKILGTVKVWEGLFRPHQDLLPSYFQFYAGLVRQGFPIKNQYVSPHQPSGYQLKAVSQKKEEPDQSQSVRKSPIKTAVDEKTFEYIRTKLSLTNEIIDSLDPSEGVRGSNLLMEMMNQLKQSEKTIQETINGSPTENIMELAIAVNDDIQITNRRFAALQKNRRPEPFLLTQISSQILKKEERQQQIKIEKTSKGSQLKGREEKPEKQKQQVDLYDVAWESKPERPANISNDLMNLDLSSGPSAQSEPTKISGGGDIFDFLGSSNQENSGQPEAVGIHSRPQQVPGYQTHSISGSNKMVPIGVTLSTNPTEDPKLKDASGRYIGELNNPNTLQGDESETGKDRKKQEKNSWDHLTDLSEFMKK